ncbi:uncharacterized protein NDAI_0J02070 [Naumovozyma dairenensis CBS 421]|uniref:DUF218 domain-containing protein n=1 Tax=Naumovozyma dairenensis (strain ATCC 10597 / BCRC 20456 / CBS 421 / NBRC 0211 / NRRL Y-12639) TaxID=1071378 RepID=G0WH21_NAUDC|nr:hypothetical protein NDAI_0J02070 [Naumovozyma dairenensis CBS 421]CCD27099.1 hypothetical protein NDAI_0J02070 [Naumovozyma dairenensis CBS 421]
MTEGSNLDSKSKTRKTKLIIVPCHSIWKIAPKVLYDDEIPFTVGASASEWFLESFQHEGNDHLAFIWQSLLAIEELLKDPEHSLLVFSGGQTKKEAGPMSEAQSYYALMERMFEYPDYSRNQLQFWEVDEKLGSCMHNLFKKYPSQFLSPDYIVTEEFALDSFDNLFYSICRFKEMVGFYPEDITVIGFGFKRKRFIDCHAKAIDFPIDHFNYISRDPLLHDPTEKEIETYLKKLDKLEKENAFSHFRRDWYARKTPLVDKKEKRNPYHRKAFYEDIKLLRLDSPSENDENHFEKYIRGKMPWSITE